MLQQASSNYDVIMACDENYNPGYGYIHLIDLPIPPGMVINSLDMIRLAFQPTWQVWCAVDAYYGDPEGYHYTYEGANTSIYNLCDYDWDSDGDINDWDREEFDVYGETDWGFNRYMYLPVWIGGEGSAELPIYVTNLSPGIQYRVILYFELVSVVNFEE